MFASEFIAGAPVAVGAGLTSLGEFRLQSHVGGQIIALEIDNSGANALTDFRIQRRDHPEGELYDYLLAADLVPPGLNSNVLFVSSDPSVLAGAAKTHVEFRINAAYGFAGLAH